MQSVTPNTKSKLVTQNGAQDSVLPPDFLVPPPKKRWPLRLLVLTLVLASMAGAGVTLQRLNQQRAAQQALDQTVVAQTVDLSERFRVSGRVQPVRQVNVSPRQAGILADLIVEEGDTVAEGQLLARMDYGDLTSALRQSQGRLQELQARLAELEAGERPETIAAATARVDSIAVQVELARKDLERFQDLAVAGVIAQDELDRRQATLEQREADLQALQEDLARLELGTRQEVIAQVRAQIAQAEAQIQQQQSRLAETEVLAPFSGVVLQRFADIGAFVTPTTSASEATAASSSSILSLAQGLEIRADVPEAQISRVQVGQEVEIQSIAFPDQIVQGRVRRIAPATIVIREVTVFRVFLEPIDRTDLLRIGMNVSVEFVGQDLPEALTVPSVALIYQDGKEGLIVWNSDTQSPQYREVSTGVTQAGLTQIVTGLEPGDRVFTALPPRVNLDKLIREATETQTEIAS